MIKQILTLIIILSLSCATYAQETNKPPRIYRTVIFSASTNSGYLSVIDALTLKEERRVEFNQPGYIIEITKDQSRAFITNLSNTSTKGITVVNLQNGFRETELFSGVDVAAIKLAPDGILWVLLPNNQQIAFVDPVSLKVIGTVNSAGSVRDIIFSPDGEFAYVSLTTSKIIKYSVKNRSSMRGGNAPITSPAFNRSMELAISPNGDILCVGSKNTITILDTTSLTIISDFTFDNKSRFGTLQLQFNQDGKILYISELDGLNFYAYNLSEGKLTKIFTSKRAEIQSLKISPDKKLLYINTFRGRVIIDTTDHSIIVSEDDLFNVLDSSLGIALAGDFSIGQAPSLVTLSPSSNQQVMANQSVTIKWNTTAADQSYSIASHKVELSTDGGNTFNLIPKAEALPADAREFAWQVPDIEALNKAQIRVSTVDLGARRASSSSGNFSITKGGGQTGDTQAPSVIFLSPKGSEKFNSGDNLQISWMSSDNVGVTSQDLSLSTDGGNTFPITIASGLPGNSQSFAFPIPTTLETNQARLRLTVRDAANNSSQALTQANFLIEQAADTIAPTITISQPTANQRLIAGQSIQVRWQSTDNRAVVNQALLLSLDGGKTFAQVASFGASDNSFVINNIDQLNFTTSQAIVRITATDSSGNIGQANAQFILTPAITNATYQSKLLTLVGIGFMANSSSSTLKLFVNDKEITLTPMISNTSLSLKGNKKKLGIVKGNNSVRLVVDGVMSNQITFQF